MSPLPVGIPAPNFVDCDPAQISRELIALFESMTGRPLRPAQPERLLVDYVAYTEALARLRLQDVGEQALVATARWPMLDYLAEFWGVTRLSAAAARTTLRFTLTAIQAAPVAVPAGTRVQSADGSATFATLAELLIPAGAAYGDATAECLTAGTSGNGYVAGQIATLLDPRPLVAGAANVTASSGGAEREDDERLRARVREAPSLPSTAGSIAGYRAHAMKASSAVIDAAVASPEPGRVRVWLLSTDGQPSPELVALVSDALSAETARPLTDTVEVLGAAEVPYAIVASIVRYAGTDEDAVRDAVTAAAEAYAADRRARLGRNLVPTQLIAALSVPGVYDVVLSSPAARDVGHGEWANCTSIAIHMVGVSGG